MPAGVSWGQYLRFSTAAFASMMAGSQVVHYYYRPLEDLQAYVEKERILHKIAESEHNQQHPQPQGT